MPGLGATDPADLEAQARAELGFSRQLEQPRRILPYPGFGGSGGYPVWYREHQIQRFNAGEAIDVSRRFWEALVKALGGYCHVDEMGKVTIHDIDPELFARRVPHSLLRIGLTNKRELWPTPIGTLCNRLLDSYNYVDSYRDIEDVIACSMLSSYVPGLTGSLNGVKDDLPSFLSGLWRQRCQRQGRQGRGTNTTRTRDKDDEDAGRRFGSKTLVNTQQSKRGQGQWMRMRTRDDNNDNDADNNNDDDNDDDDANGDNVDNKDTGRG